MKYHDITTSDILNGDDLGVVLWVSGCDHRCLNCHNPITWDHNYGLEFNESAESELMIEVSKHYHKRVTFSGGDPLNDHNVRKVSQLINKIRSYYPDKKIWIYSGYTWEEIFNKSFEEFIQGSQADDYRKIAVDSCDVFVDGRFIESLKDDQLKWVGSSNQRVIDVKKSRLTGEIVLYQ